ncbi:MULTISPECIES: peptidyl-tRNA hydrolase [unclassified Gordonia (in: high G+C Gram-positive bacteria)]|uniref:peptidyl-tRNA hydrolase n=1 Tax=unclassified Gordonia (in: high G+C Gram-positive bacteria) TaxID=2657482 RepID=UPI001FFF7E4A|nr:MULTISPECIES: peptidyl-tRNA hydrolase [unclassified Gordonia (in: high G+C Gram-positive bacteria)]UQE73996.1 peptidyl-tRNA hydrolase [Gordonia sp. PP30]
MALTENLSRLTGYTPRRADPDDPAAVLAMPLVLHLPKADPPPRAAVLEAAARATVLACLDPRAAAGGEWADAFDAWCAGRIRKIARRARGASWAAVDQVPGITVDAGGAQARACVPGPVGATDRRIAKLQIGGTEVPGDLSTERPAPGTLGLWVAPDLPMTVGKLAAQVSHASMLGAPLLARDRLAGWYDDGCPLAVRQATRARWAELLAAEEAGTAIAVRDAGYTEVTPGSCTVIAEVA